MRWKKINYIFWINKDSIFNAIKLHSIIKHKNGLGQVIIQMVSIQKYILMRLIISNNRYGIHLIQYN